MEVHREGAQIAPNRLLRAVVRAPRQKRREPQRKPQSSSGRPNNREQDAGRNLDSKGHSAEVSERNEEHVTGNWKKGDPVIKWPRSWLIVFVFYCFVAGSICK